MSTDSLFLYHFRSSDNLSLVSPARSPSSSESLTPTPTPTSHNTLIRVRAQAMTVDDSTGLWKVIKGNPAADLKLMKEGDDCYIITAHRHTDRQVSQKSLKIQTMVVLLWNISFKLCAWKGWNSQVCWPTVYRKGTTIALHSLPNSLKNVCPNLFFIPRHASKKIQDM